MISPSLEIFARLKFDGLSPACLARYGYSLTCCRAAAAASAGEYGEKIVRLCDVRLNELSSISPRYLAYQPSSSCSGRLRLFDQDLADLSDDCLLELHAMAPGLGEKRRKAGLEPLTRVGQWRIIAELTARCEHSPVAQLLQLAEYFEADHLARLLSLPYSIGRKPRPFIPSAWDSDEALVDHIRMLSARPTYTAREELIAIADHIQVAIVDAGATADHLPLVSAILSTGLTQFNYPKILKALEKATRALAASGTRSSMELAPIYRVLWSHTLKAGYLNRYENAVRHCYLTLADGHSYPGLGIDTGNPRSLRAALRFLDENRRSLWIISPRYDVDKVIRKYQTCV